MLDTIKKVFGHKSKENTNSNTEFQVDVNSEPSQFQADLNKVVKENKKRLMDLHQIEFDNKDINEMKNKCVKDIYSALRLVEADSKHVFLLRQFHLVDFPNIIKEIEAIDAVRKIKKVRPDVMVTLVDEASNVVVRSIKQAAKNLEKVKN